MLFVLTAYLSSSCEKEQISPISQQVAFVKYYGHVGTQTATDVIETLDGGYILLGSTNSYSSRQETDVLVVKTDSLGNELWSASFGRQEGNVDSKFDYLRFSEEGVRILELSDQSAYVVAANRTYFNYPTANSNLGVRGQTKVVLYQLDHATGTPSSTSGVELRESTNDQFTEEASDMKLDTTGGRFNYILTGSTTNIVVNKPTDNDNGLYDKTDIFTILLEADFSQNASWQNLAYGFPGSDYGTSVQVLTDGYLICGTTESKRIAPGQSGLFVPRLLTVVMEKAGGTPLNPKYFGDDEYYFSGGQSTFDATNQIVTVAGYVDKELGSNSNTDKGKVALLKLQVSGIFLTAITPGGTGDLRYYDLGDRNGGAGAEHLVASIALLPASKGFILSSTQKMSRDESDLCVTKFDNDLNIETGWPYFFGYADGNSLVLTQDEAGSIVPITSGATVDGYVFTGKFGLGTNEMMGLVRLNSNGTLIP